MAAGPASAEAFAGNCIDAWLALDNIEPLAKLCRLAVESQLASETNRYEHLACFTEKLFQTSLLAALNATCSNYAFLPEFRMVPREGGADCYADVVIKARESGLFVGVIELKYVGLNKVSKRAYSKRGLPYGPLATTNTLEADTGKAVGRAEWRYTSAARAKHGENNSMAYVAAWDKIKTELAGELLSLSICASDSGSFESVRARELPPAWEQVKRYARLIDFMNEEGSAPVKQLVAVLVVDSVFVFDKPSAE